MAKRYKIPAEQIRDIARGYGACFASDEILVGGFPVGYMYREDPDFSEDSGWRFLSGGETQQYVDDPDNFAIYDVNTVANYDPAIVPFLSAPIGSAFERDGAGQLVPMKSRGDGEAGQPKLD